MASEEPIRCRGRMSLILRRTASDPASQLKGERSTRTADAKFPWLRSPLGAGLPRGVDAEGMSWSRHEMRFRGAHALASMRGRTTMLLPGSQVLNGGDKPLWVARKRDELLQRGAMRPIGDNRLLLVVTIICFDTAYEAATFVSGGASISARLIWTPMDP